jgi:hypothetical protein
MATAAGWVEAEMAAAGSGMEAETTAGWVEAETAAIEVKEAEAKEVEVMEAEATDWAGYPPPCPPDTSN